MRTLQRGFPTQQWCDGALNQTCRCLNHLSKGTTQIAGARKGDLVLPAQCASNVFECTFTDVGNFGMSMTYPECTTQFLEFLLRPPTL